jgi:hypothetical protein
VNVSHVERVRYECVCLFQEKVSRNACRNGSFQDAFEKKKPLIFSR